MALSPSYGYTGLFDYNAANKSFSLRGTANTNNYNLTCLSFLDASNLFAYSYGALLYPVSSSGLGTAKSLSYPASCVTFSGKMAADGTGRIYSITPTAQSQTGSVVLSNTYFYYSNPVAIDSSLGSIFYLANTSGNAYSSNTDGLYSYDLASYLRTGSIGLNIPTIEGSSYISGSFNDLIRWGQDGLALVSSTGHLYLLRGPFVVPQELNTNTAATLTSASSSTLAVGTSNTLLTLSGSNFLPGVAVTWNGSYRSTTIVDATHVTVAIPAADLAAAGTGKLVATNPGATASGAVTVTVQ